MSADQTVALKKVLKPIHLGNSRWSGYFRRIFWLELWLGCFRNYRISDCNSAGYDYVHHFYF